MSEAPKQAYVAEPLKQNNIILNVSSAGQGLQGGMASKNTVLPFRSPIKLTENRTTFGHQHIFDSNQNENDSHKSNSSKKTDRYQTQHLFENENNSNMKKTNED